MPNIVPTARYYPRLSEVITVDDLPEFLSFVQDGLNTIFDKIHYKNLQYSKSYRGDSAFYSLEIVSSTKLAIPLPFDLALVLNPDITGGDSTISSFPITLEYQWEILAFLKSFNLEGFSFSLEDFYKVGLQVFRISEEQVLSHILNNFVEPVDEDTSKFQQLIDDLNSYLNISPGLVLPTNPDIQSVIAAINDHPDINDTISAVMFGSYILDSDADEMKTKLQGFFNIVVPDGIETYIKKLITPKAKATLALSAGIEFPHNVLKPVNEDGSDFGDSNRKSTFIFAEAQLYVDTEAGMGFQLELAGTLYPQFNAIGNTGILLEIDSLKLDLSKKTNIPEADADGRPNDFVGVYARAISVTLPSKWFHDDTEPATNITSTLRLGAYDLLVGTGGLSGTILLETVPVVTAGNASSFNYFNDKFSFNYPITMHQKNAVTNVIEEKIIANYTELLAYLQVLNAAGLPYDFKFPLALTTTAGVTLPTTPSTIYSFINVKDYQLFLKGLEGDTHILWKQLGGFRIGFKEFDISFHQNKVISSNIAGALEIKKFVYPGTTDPVKIDVEGHLHDNGDFNLTASSVDRPYNIEWPNVFTYAMRSVELGKEDGDFYIGTSGKLQFKDVPILGNLQAIDIDRLRIYSDGSVEFQGGSIALAKPFVLPLGPVEITVTAIHYGSHQKEVNGEMRKFNYFGFDGGVSIDPLGVEVRGDGVKLYYCVDNLPNKPHPYLHIQTLYVDLTIPASTPAVVINGWLSIPEPGVSPEYAGGIKIKIPKAKIAGGADMKLAPKHPAFIIDAELELPTPIPLGSFAIYGFRGLIGYRYVAEKEAIGLVSGVNTWYEYYKAPVKGINVRKFRRPTETSKHKNPVSIGAGATLGTSYDDGYTMSIKAMVLLSIPSLFMIDGRANVLSKRLGLDDGGDPPFFAFVALGDNSLEFGFGADYKLPKANGNIFSLYADVQAGFFFKDSSKWYVNFGTKTNPVTARVLTLITLKSFLMLSAKGIEAGARGEFVFKKKYGPVKVAAWAYVEVGGKISFQRPQMGSYIAAGVGAKIDIRILHLYVSLDILFGAEASQPFLIYGKFRLCVRVKILFVKIRFCGNVQLTWEFNKTVDRTPINPLIANSGQAKLNEVVKGVNMLTNEPFDLVSLELEKPNLNTVGIIINSEGIPVAVINNNQHILPDVIKNAIIPLDTYIDIKSEKGLLPGAISNLIGGVNNPPSRYTDLIPPDAVVKGKALRQVKHQYVVDAISIKAWNGTAWVDYHPYKAMYPNETSNVFNSLKIGQWQKVDGQYNAIRLLATTPFSYTEQGEPGWYIPEQYGVTASSLFCEGQEIEKHCATFLSKPLGHKYYCYDSNNHFFYSNEASFMLLNSQDDEYAEVIASTNVFDIDQSLAFENSNTLQIILPQSSYEVDLRVSNYYHGVKVKYYSALIQDDSYEVLYGHPDTNLTNVQRVLPYEVVVPVEDLNEPIHFSLANHEGWDAIAKIEIEPYFSEATNSLIASIRDQIAEIEDYNMQIMLGEIQGEYQSTATLEAQLEDLLHAGSIVIDEVYRYQSENNFYTKLISGLESTWYPTWFEGDPDNPSAFDFYVDYENHSVFIQSNDKIIDVKLLQIDNYEGDLTGLYTIVHQTDFKVEVVINESIEIIGDVFDFDIVYQKEGNCCGILNENLPTFIKSYAGGGSYHFYYDSLKIDDALYAVGFYTEDYEDYGLITKTDTSGNIIWQKKYKNSFGVNLQFNSVVSCDNSDLMLVANSGRFNVIYRISPDGTILWKKHYVIPELIEEVSTKINKLGGEKYVLSIVQFQAGSVTPGGAGGNSSIFTDFIKINGEGTILNKKSVFGSFEVACSDEKIVLLSNEINGSLNIGVVCVLDTDLNLINKFALKLVSSGNEFLQLKNAVFQGDTIVLSGGVVVSNTSGGGGGGESLAKNLNNTAIDNNDYEYEFVTKIDISNNYPKYGTQVLIMTMFGQRFLKGELYSNLACNEDFIYLNIHENYVVKFNAELEALWAKEYGSPLNIDEVKDQAVIFHGYQYATENTPELSYLGQMNLELDSCKKVGNPDFGVVEKFSEFVDAENHTFGYSIVTAQHVDFLEENEVTNVSSEPFEICSTILADTSICDLYHQIETIYQTNFNPIDFNAYQDYVTPAGQILDLLKPETELLSYSEFEYWYNVLNNFYTAPSSSTLNDGNLAIRVILDDLDQLGNCRCKCDEQENSSKTILHSVCWLSREEYEYNVNIPGQGAISEDAFATVAGINQYIQPIWRPDTSYLVHFKLKDIVDNKTATPYSFTYGFSTAGPVGFFHTHPKAKYGDIKRSDNTVLDDTTGVVTDAMGNVLPLREEPHPDKYPLTSLRQYIDYQRSYPNADGNLLSAKPLFYDDDINTKVSLYFTKAYATHFFKEWDADPQKGLGAIKGQMKIVIKDPREDVSIINPPSLNGVIDTINIPQTEEEWTEDTAPLVPFVLSQWINMFMTNENCIFLDKPEVIKPASKYLSVKLHKLKPQKLYTALVNNIYDLDKDGVLGPLAETNPETNEITLTQVDETREVHKFTFQTSRYKNFKDQVESYLLFEGEGDTRVERKAFFEIKKAISETELTVLQNTIQGNSIAGLLPEIETNALLSNYLHPFDRAIEGILKMNPINAAISTEINFIRNTESGNVVAILVKNPEPFNNPKMPIEAVLDTIEVLTNGIVDTSYKVLHSKDYSQVFIMPTNKIVRETFGLQFKYKIWDGIQYVVNETNPNDTVVIENININSQN